MHIHKLLNLNDSTSIWDNCLSLSKYHELLKELCISTIIDK